MVWSRKHYRGSYAADLWVMDVDKKTSRKILDNDTPDDQKANNFWPMFANGFIYFVSDRGVQAKAGSPEVLRSRNNIWKVPAQGGEPVQVTDHTSGSLFWPSLSSDGRVIVYEEDFGLCKLDVASGQVTRLKIDIVSDEKENNLETLVVNGECDSYNLSPSGRRAVIATHGDLFTIATGRGDVRRLTQTPGVRETQPRWSPDGKWIAFVADTGGRDEVWLCDENGGQLKQISKSDSQKAQIVWSPDSKALLYTGSDKKLYKYTLDGDKTDVLATGNATGFGGSAIMGPQWSPDGKWVSYTRPGDNLLPHVYVIPAEGGKEKRITDEQTYSDTNAVWTPDGKRLIYLAGTDIANIGQGGRSTAQLFVVTLTPEERDPTDRDIDSEADAQRQQREQRAGGRGGRGGAADAGDGGPARVEVKINFEGIARRARTLTRTGDTVGSVAVSPDGRTVVFTTTDTEAGRSQPAIWSVGIDGSSLTRVAQVTRPAATEDGPPAGRFGGGGLSSLQFARDGRTLYFHQGSGIYAVTVSAAPADDSAALTVTA
jgi:tricorn protease